MSNNPTDKPISKRHIIWATLVLTFLFTYAGVKESIWESFTDIGFNINFILNFVQIYLLIRLTYYLHFTKKSVLWKSIAISLGVFYLLQLLQVNIIDYEADDYTELYSITLPFGSLILLIFNFYYNLINKKSNSLLDDNTPEPIWLDTSTGRVKLFANTIKYAYLTDVYLEIHTESNLLKTFYSLKQLEELLSNENSFFRLNKQYLCQKNAISTFKPLSDGRLELTLFNNEKCIVSKNKASSFKKWINET
ncbi:LytTR family DNA-binding domain-containing protein [Aureibaculum conchae]|uniref:LytTR family DNA-binding domain-containing protein n=1 Tax=Aureibaculum sp. 2308TA14-22 TaxID=3108392 RepID=UPI003392A51B